ncbi:ATP-binding protein [Yeosuana sp. AK3]
MTFGICFHQILKSIIKSEIINELGDVFDKKKGDILKQIGEVLSKLKDITTKRKEYEAIKIETILERVAKKPPLDLEKKNLSDEKEILTSKFLEIQQRYEAQLKQLLNQLKEFENIQQTEKNSANSHFLNTKEELAKQYELIYDDVRHQHKEQLETANKNVKEKEKSITDNKIKLSEAKHKRFFETEIETCKTKISAIKSAISKAETQTQQATKEIKNIQREWEFEEKNIKADTTRKVELKIEEEEKYNRLINAIETKVENSKNSLYGWLNQHIPDWDKTIGKVIDEENVLFLQGLNPQMISETNLSFYGISIDTSEINKSVKTVADLQQDQEELKRKIQDISQTILKLNAQSNDELEKLKRKFKPKIKEEKELIQQNEYIQTTSKAKLDELTVLLTDLESKAKTEKKTLMDNIEANISKLSEEKIKAEEQVQKIENSITKNMNTKKREKASKTKVEQQKLSDTIKRLDEQIQNEKKIINEKTELIKANQKKELESKGANTERIDKIDLRLSLVEFELNFIENNRDKVAEYNKDKRELFNKEAEFKNNKSLFDKQLDTESEKYKQQKNKLIQQIGSHNAEIDAINKTLSSLQKDLDAFESFTKTEIFESVEQYIASFSDEHKSDNSGTYLINELNTNDNTIIKRYVELQEAINKFTGNFQENNLFSFKVKLAERDEYFEFAEMLKEFVEENKIAEYKQRVEERFAHIIRQIGRETNSLIEKEGEISKVITEINNDFIARQFVTAIKSVELKTTQSANSIFQLLVEIKNYNDDNTFNLGKPDLFTSKGQGNTNEKAISLLKQLIKEMAVSREKEITLSDSFELLFKIVENDNDTGWVEKLTNVGSEGTDVLIKAMINIMLLNVFKEKASKKHKDDFRLHCMMDEIGKLHPNNVKGILKFANDRNILLINSSPTSLNATDYRYTYLLSKDNKNVTNIKRLVRKITKSEG